MARGVVYTLTLALTAVLAFLTVWVLMREGVTVVVAFALVIVALLVFGALGALARSEKR
jgi:VIT1/CCC1 family predicted Fe2+/Mn2+ transporter